MHHPIPRNFKKKKVSCVVDIFLWFLKTMQLQANKLTVGTTTLPYLIE
jgi:hypothetical protein